MYLSLSLSLFVADSHCQSFDDLPCLHEVAADPTAISTALYPPSDSDSWVQCGVSSKMKNVSFSYRRSTCITKVKVSKNWHGLQSLGSFLHMLVGCLSFTLIFPFQQQTMKKSSPSIRHEDNWYNCVSKCDITVYFELNNSLINIFHFNRLWFYLNEKPLAIMVSDNRTYICIQILHNIHVKLGGKEASPLQSQRLYRFY